MSEHVAEVTCSIRARRPRYLVVSAATKSCLSVWQIISGLPRKPALSPLDRQVNGFVRNKDIFWPHSTEDPNVGEAEVPEPGVQMCLGRPNTSRRLIRRYTVFSGDK